LPGPWLEPPGEQRLEHFKYNRSEGREFEKKRFHGFEVVDDDEDIVDSQQLALSHR
jgi:hypothetical protein